MTTDDRNSTTPVEGRLDVAAGRLADEAGRTAEVTADRSMAGAADALDQVSKAMRRAQQELRTEQPQIADVMDTVVRQIDRGSAFLRERQPREVLDEAQRLARQQPAIVIAGGLAVGLLVGRLLRTAGSTMSVGSPGSDRWYGDGGAHAGSDRYGRAAGSGRYGRYGRYEASGDGASGYGSGGYAGAGTSYAGGVGSTGATDVGDPNASIIASGSVTERGSAIDTGTPGATEKDATLQRTGSRTARSSDG